MAKSRPTFAITSAACPLLDVSLFAKCVRNHWGIESTCHWSLDVTYNADGLTSRNRLGTENMARLRRFTLSLLNQHPGNVSLAMKRKSWGWNWKFLLQFLGIKGTSCALAPQEHLLMLDCLACSIPPWRLNRTQSHLIFGHETMLQNLV